MVDLLAGATITGYTETPPLDKGILRLASNGGYSIYESIADLVDNSIDASAKNVLVRLFHDGAKITQLAVVDDGLGMAPDKLIEAMQLGFTDKADSDLGHYGLGLKSASLSHAGSLEVVSRRDAETAGVRLTADGISENGWKVANIERSDASQFMDREWSSQLNVAKHGTAVLWGEMAQFSSQPGQINQRFGQFSRHLSNHLGLFFHRFIENGLNIWIDLKDLTSDENGLTREVMPLNPFPQTSGVVGYPVTFHANFAPTLSMDLGAYIWPANTKSPGYNLDGRAAQRQGFYCYRNDRLLQAGGWNGWRNNDSEPHLSLARVRLELPPSGSPDFKLSFQKNRVVFGTSFADGLNAVRSGTTSMFDYIRAAQDAYGPKRTASKSVAVVGASFPKQTRKQMNSVLAPDVPANSQVEIDMKWELLPKEEVVRVEPNSKSILLNSRYKKVQGASTGKIFDEPVVRALIFFLLGDAGLKATLSSKSRKRQAELNAFLLASLGVTGV